MVRTEIGEILLEKTTKSLLSNKRITVKLTPSFCNLLSLGDPDKIIEIYATLLNDKHIDLMKCLGLGSDDIVLKMVQEHIKKQSEYANQVIICCANGDISPFKLNVDMMINIASSLMLYGVRGMARIRISQRNEHTEFTNKFDINQFITNARVFLGLSLDEAKSLTMTEYTYLMATKFPDNEGLTRKEYDETMANDDRISKILAKKEGRDYGTSYSW